MFSIKEKQTISEKIEKMLLELNHPEMPKNKPSFHLQIVGKESWSWADIVPNWTFNENNKPTINPFNEIANR